MVRRAPPRASRRAGRRPTRRSSTCATARTPTSRAAFYARAGAGPHLLDGVNQLHGKELSFNNLLDLSSARELVEDFDEPACAIVKHNNPCGCAVADSAEQAYERAFACDPQSAYGGVIALNRPVDRAAAEKLSGQFIEVLLAPAFEPAALEILQGKKNVRLLELPDWPARSERVEGKPVLGGQLVQTRDEVAETREQMHVMTAAEPDEEQWQDLLFAWRVCRHVRSNAIVIARGRRHDRDRRRPDEPGGRRPHRDREGTGLPARAAGRLGLASDAFFPFADGPELALEAGVTAIIQPGGSVRDEEVVAAVDAAGASMVATGTPPLPPLSRRRFEGPFRARTRGGLAYASCYDISCSYSDSSR